MVGVAFSELHRRWARGWAGGVGVEVEAVGREDNEVVDAVEKVGKAY